jgi:serine/threonine protein kinase
MATPETLVLPARPEWLPPLHTALPTADQPSPVETLPSTSPPPPPRHPADRPVDRAPVPQCIPGHELMERLGRGSFGEVWKARGPGGVEVALKFIRLDQDAAGVEQRSIELVKNVRHAHLLGCFAAWRWGGYLVLGQELADGSLQDRARAATAQGSPGIPREELLEAMHEAAKGIDFLNSRQIQHRDIKPQNLLLLGGSVKVADFGLAKLLQDANASNSGSMTPAYAAPEFFRGRTSSRSDQYSLAVTYVHLRSGRLPFAGSCARVMVGHLHQPPDLTMLPAEERPVVARTLAKSPEERWPSCRAFVEALAQSVQVPSPAPPSDA